MTRYLVTGAAGFLGLNLQRALLARLTPGDELTVQDRVAPPVDAPLPSALPAGVRFRAVTGDLAEPAVLSDALSAGPQVVFHLASVPGGLAERDHAAGSRMNVHATLELFSRLAQQAGVPTVIYASSVAVYGAHKLMMELALSDFSRRGELRGVALRLPGLVARPDAGAGFGSAFMSGVIRAVAAGQPYACPVSPGAAAWWMSADCAARNLLHAATLSGPVTLHLPALHLSVAEVVAATSAACGAPPQVRYQPDEETERLFGRFPPLRAPLGESLGFRHDGAALPLARAALGAM